MMLGRCLSTTICCELANGEESILFSHRWLSLFPLAQTTTNAVAVVATMQYSAVPDVNIIFACGLLSIEGRCGYGWAAVRSPSGSGRKSGRNRTLSQRAVKWFESSSSGFASYFLRAHYVLFFIILFFSLFPHSDLEWCCRRRCCCCGCCC